MKWKKHGRNSKRPLFFEFWDGLTNDNEMICFIRYDKRHEHYEVFSNSYEYDEMQTNIRSTLPFKSLKEAKDHCVAWLVNKRLEEAND